MRVFGLMPVACLPLSLALGMGFLVQWVRADGAEYRAHEWERVAREQSVAMAQMMKADLELKAASSRLQAACAARSPDL